MVDLNLSSLDSYSYEPLRKQVYDLLRDTILRGKLKPGEKITEVEIAEQLNVSRTPVREAFRMLELEELIIKVPRQGIFVAGIKSKKEIDDIFQVRIELEGLAASLAARNITDKQLQRMKDYVEEIKDCIQENNLNRCIEIDIAFHQIIKDASGNKLLEKYLDSLFEQVTRFRARSLAKKERMEKALTDHKEIYRAISDGDPLLARRLARKHIEGAWASIISVFEKEQAAEDT